MDVLNKGLIDFTGAAVRTISIETLAGGVGGNYTQTQEGTLRMRIIEDQGHQTDRLNIAGTATLGGTLDIDLVGAAPQGNNPLVWTILTFDNNPEQFDTLLLPPSFSIGYGNTTANLVWNP